MAADRQPDLKPVDVDVVPIVAIGTAVWALALVVVIAVPAWRTAHGGLWLWTCVAAVGLGLIGMVYVRRLRARGARARPDDPRRP